MAALSIITAILGFAFVIFIHELGHFLFAKWAGVKVERFSIGMGPIIWSRTIGETEYALSILPIGGYVKMLGQEDMPGHRVESDDERSYTNKHPGWRAAILFGGVLFNIVSSYIILLCLAWYGMPVFNPQIGTISPYVIDQNGDRQETPAYQQDLHVGDEILSVNGNKVRSYTDLMMYTIADNTEPITLALRRQNGEEYEVEMNGVYDRERGTHTLGIELPRGLRIGYVTHTADHQTPLKSADRIVGIKGSDEDFDQLRLVGEQVYNRLSPYIGQDIGLVIERNGERREERIRYAGQSPIDILMPSLGVLPFVEKVTADSPAMRAGILPGDYLSAVNGVRILNISHISGLIREADQKGEAIHLEIYRFEQGQWQAQTLVLETQLDKRLDKAIIGVIQSPYIAGPILPGLTSTQEQGLAAHGIQAGDVIVDYDAELGDGKIASIDILHAPAAELQLLSFTEEHNKVLYHVQRPGFFARLFGVDAQPSIQERLMGSIVMKAATEDDNKMLVKKIPNPLASKEAVAEDHNYSISLVDFTPEQRQVFYQMQAGDVIISMRARSPDAAPAFMLGRGIAESDLSWKRLAPENMGTAIFLMPDERPYQLESWTEAFSMANESCKNIVVTTLRIIPRFFKKPEDGGIDATKSLSGPIGIFTGMKQKTEHFGFASFLRLLAFIGINLFLVNLLPIPIVDGGQLVFLAIEVIIRRPVPVVVVEAANWVGFLLIVSLMIFILGIDIDRHFLS